MLIPQRQGGAGQRRGDAARPLAGPVSARVGSAAVKVDTGAAGAPDHQEGGSGAQGRWTIARVGTDELRFVVAQSVIVDQAQSLRELSRDGQTARTRLIAVASGKGGVGKTSICVNLAARLAKMGRRVVLVDADLGTANADLLCDLTPHAGLGHVVAGRKQLSEVTLSAPGGFDLVPGASGLARVASLSEFERARLIDQMRQLESRSDLLLLDCGAGVSPNVLSFAVAADSVMVVTTPEPTAITDAYALIKTMWRQRQQIDVAVLVNQVRDAEEARAVYCRLEAVCRKFLSLSPRFAGHLVQDARVAMAVRRRKPFVVDSPQCEASRCITHLAHRLERHGAEPRQGGLLQRMAGWLAG